MPYPSESFRLKRASESMLGRYPAFALPIFGSLGQEKEPRLTRLNFEGPSFIFKGYEKKDWLWVPEEVAWPPAGSFEHKRARHASSFLQRVLLVRNEEMQTPHWQWLGVVKSGYPTMNFLGRGEGAVRVFVAMMINSVPKDVRSRKLCRFPNCVSPFHYEFEGVYNVPQDPILRSNPSFWKFSEVLPWQHGLMGLRAEAEMAEPIAERPAPTFEEMFPEMVKMFGPGETSRSNREE